MDLVFGHDWALWWWRYTYKNANPDAFRQNYSLENAASTTDELKKANALEVRQSQLDRGFPRDIPMGLIARGSEHLSRSSEVKVRAWNGRVPFREICEVGNQHVSSPEFTYLLIASSIDALCNERMSRWQHSVILAELGCELCGTYSKQNSPAGFKNRDMPLTSTCRIFSFLNRMAHQRGVRQAYDAMLWVIDGLNSPMETALHLMLCLPRAMGGLACIMPKANDPLNVPQKLVSKARRNVVTPDLYWAEWELAAEFFGEEPHKGRERADYERRETEQDMGLTVVTFWKEDMLNLDRFNARAAVIMQRLGVKPPKYNEKFCEKQRALQRMLVMRQRWV